jgi:glycosyltransferase involved in cell wall biosynthesis
MEPENNVDLIIESFLKVGTEKELVVVGDVFYKSSFARKIKNINNPRVRFLGAIYDKDKIRELFCNAFAYVHGHEVGGTNPSLLKAMGCGILCLALKVLFNLEVLDDAGIFFNKEPNDLARKMDYLIKNPEHCAEKVRKEGEN